MLVARRRHAEVLMPAIDELCRWAGWSVGDLTGVAVDRGPGLFTGLRVGLATARAIAAARDIPAIGVTSLDALAHAGRRWTGLVAAVVDARRGEVYWALYGADGATAQELRSPAVVTPETLAGHLDGLAGPVLALGDGASRYAELLTAAGATVGEGSEMWPSAMAVAELGMRQLAVGGATHRGLPEPLYLRQADVRIGWEQVGGRTGAQPGAQPGVQRDAHSGGLPPQQPERSAGISPARSSGPGAEGRNRTVTDSAAAASASPEPKLAP
jgi:tRNA threonylcarbamoyladenosine biosynthesis protein TsaB